MRLKSGGMKCKYDNLNSRHFICNFIIFYIYQRKFYEKEITANNDK